MIALDTAFVLIESSMTVEMALKRMGTFKPARWVVVHRLDRAQVYWYAFEAEEARARFKHPSIQNLTVQEVLGLHEGGSRPIHSLEGTDSEVVQRGDLVVSPSNRVLGVAVPPGPPMPPPARPRPFDAPTSSPAPTPPSSSTELFMAEDKGGLDSSWSFRGGPSYRGASSRDREVQEAPSTHRRGSTKIPHLTHAAPPVGQVIPEVGTAGLSPGAAIGPFQAWPDVGAPSAVEDGCPFDLRIGFSAQQVDGVISDIISLPAMPREFDLQLQLVAIGFKSSQGVLHALHVIRDDPGRIKLTLQLIADLGGWHAEKRVAQRILGVIFSYQGMPCGMAQRNILVTEPGFKLSASELEAPSSFVNQRQQGVPVRLLGGVVAPDLTVTLRRYDGNAARANFAWCFESPHPINLPAPIPCEIADDAASYARGMTSEIVELGEAHSPLLSVHLKGCGRDIADHMPAEVWRAIANARHHLGAERKIPDIFFVTEESCIPWELAMMPEPLDPGQPGFLGAQVNFGRWIVGDPAPGLPPNPLVDVDRMVVVYGDYPRPSDRLPEALQERDNLAGNYQAVPVAIDDLAMVDVLQGTNPHGGCQVLHFACHGSGDPTDPAHTRLKTHSGAPLTDNALRGAALGEQSRPFLFLNACEAGVAGDELGTASGFVEAALKNGFRGFVGALWQVDSETARDIAATFYKRTLEEGASVAEAMREIRCAFDSTQPLPQDTYLAYVFYGHPALKLKRKPQGQP